MKKLFKSTNYKTFDEFSQVVEEFLYQNLKDQDLDLDLLIFCIKELLNNSFKSNSKRVFFKNEGKNIFDKKDYLDLKPKFLEQKKYIMNYHHKKYGYYISFGYYQANGKLYFIISNNVKLTSYEKQNIAYFLNQKQDICKMQQAPFPEGGSLGLLSVKKFLDLNNSSESIDCICGNNTVLKFFVPVCNVANFAI